MTVYTLRAQVQMQSQKHSVHRRTEPEVATHSTPVDMMTTNQSDMRHMLQQLNLPAQFPPSVSCNEGINRSTGHIHL